MPKTGTIIIQCSARSKGDSSKITRALCEKFGFDAINLCELNIHPFDYNQRHADDDFLPTIQNLVDNYQNLLFLTPVYWYTMSARMKIFLDRISDLLKWHKETGRKLRGMGMGLISVSNDPILQEHFEVPVRLSAEYLGMHYHGHIHCWVSEGMIADDVKKNLELYISAFNQDQS